jgi:hypothetical protein
MPSSINVVLQVVALVAVTLMRAAQPGWLMIMFMLSVIGPLTLFAQVSMAMTARRLPRLPASLTVPFFVAAASLVAANLVLADMDDRQDYSSPLESIVGPMPDTTGLGVTLLLVWGGALLWVRVVMDAKKAEFQRTEGEGHVRSAA